MRKPPVKFPWRPESVRVAVVPADPPPSEIGPKPEVCSFDRREGAQNRENELPARKRRLRAHGSLMW